MHSEMNSDAGKCKIFFVTTGLSLKGKEAYNWTSGTDSCRFYSLPVKLVRGNTEANKENKAIVTKE